MFTVPYHNRMCPTRRFFEEAKTKLEELQSYLFAHVFEYT